MLLEEEIAERVGAVRTESLDVSFGELASLHESRELIIQPEYQRLFRWSTEQRSQLIESILLQLPIPQIFVIENPDGVLELIDGLQRISTVLQFMTPAAIELEPLKLDGCKLITGLNEKTFETLPLSLRLGLKRTPIRMVIIKKQSQAFLRYEMFKRLNTGGANLEPQEIRNCSVRMLGEPGINFYGFLVDLASSEEFAPFIEYIPEADRDKKAAEEFVLRYFAAKNSANSFKGSVRDWLDDYLETLLIGGTEFDYEAEKRSFKDVMRVALEKLGDTAFLRYRDGRPLGSLPPAYFEAIAIGLSNSLATATEKSPDSLRSAVTQLVESPEFRAVTGPGANSKEKLNRRIRLVSDAIESA